MPPVSLSRTNLCTNLRMVQTVLAALTDDFLLMMDKDQAPMLVLLELSAAFGTDDHEVLVTYLRTLEEWMSLFA